MDDVFDLSQFRYGNVPEAITEQPGTTTGLSEADIRGAVGGSNTLFSSSTDAQEEVPKPVNVASTEADSPQVNVAEAMDVDKPTPVVEGDVDVVPIVLDAAPSDTLDVTPSPVDDVSVPLVSTEGSVPASDAAMNTPADVEML